MDTDTDFKRRAFAGYFSQLEKSPGRGCSPDWDESFTATGPDGRAYVVLLDSMGRLVCPYRIGNQSQLRRLVRLPRFLKEQLNPTH